MANPDPSQGLPPLGDDSESDSNSPEMTHACDDIAIVPPCANAFSGTAQCCLEGATHLIPVDPSIWYRIPHDSLIKTRFKTIFGGSTVEIQEGPKISCSSPGIRFSGTRVGTDYP